MPYPLHRPDGHTESLFRGLDLYVAMKFLNTERGIVQDFIDSALDILCELSPPTVVLIDTSECQIVG